VTDHPQTSGERPPTPGVAPPTLGDQPRVVAGAPLGTQSPAMQLPPAAQAALSRAQSAIQEKPELGVGGAFAGGIVLALILKRLAS
jgi:hypothetical protein